MADQIISIATIRAKARDDFYAGRARDDHGFNWHAACLPEYLKEYDRLAAQASPASHAAPAGRARVDLRQGGAA